MSTEQFSLMRGWHEASEISNPDMSKVGLYLGIGAVVLGIALFAKTSSASSLPTGTAPGQLPATGGGGPTGGATGGTGGATGGSGAQTLSSLLNNSQQARQVYNVQALAYAMAITDERPDGLFGGKTQQMINDAEGMIGSAPSRGFSADKLAIIRRAGERLGRSPRLVPGSLSGSVLTKLQQDAYAADAQAINVLEYLNQA